MSPETIGFLKGCAMITADSFLSMAVASVVGVLWGGTAALIAFFSAYVVIGVTILYISIRKDWA